MGFLDPATRRGLFDRGAIHFNARRFWEAHEDWEAVWNEEEDPKRAWIQGLIQYAAAFVHFERGFHASGFVKLVRSARQKTDGYAGDTEGIRFDLLRRDLSPWHEHAERVAAGADLVAGAPPLPEIRWAEGVKPAPHPPEDVD